MHLVGKLFFYSLGDDWTHWSFAEEGVKTNLMGLMSKVASIFA